MTSLLRKYPPRSADDVLLEPRETIENLNTWLSQCGAGAVAVVTGPRGSGVTTLLTLLAKKLNMEPVFITASNARNKSFIADAASSPIAVNFRRKVLIFDEYDAIAADTGLQTDLSSFLRRKPSVPVVLASKPSRSSKVAEFTKKFDRFDLRAADPGKFARVLESVSAGENMHVSPREISEITSRAKGDVRAAFAELAMRLGTTKDHVSEGLDALDEVVGMDSPGVAECLRCFRQDPSAVPMGLFENYPLMCPANRIDACAQAAESFSAGDVFEASLYETQSWHMSDVYGAMTVAAPAMLVPRKARVPKMDKFGTVWSKMYNQAAKKKHVQDIARARAGLVRLADTDLGLLRGIVAKSLDNADFIRATGLGSPEILGLMRLWKTEYRQSTHARLKKALDDKTLK